ncbi:MAG: response regulator [Anaerolineales bacterium]
MTDKPKILIVDDKEQNLFALEQTLKNLPVDVLQATSGNDALTLVLEHEFALAIVDVQMPEMDGYELVELLRKNTATSRLPTIFVSAIYSDEYHHRKGYDSGAVDFMSKPFVPEILLSKVNVFIDLYEKRRELQNTVDELHRTNTTLSRRTMQLETSIKVSQQITSILDLKELLSQLTSIVKTQFNYPSVSIWLMDNAQRNLTLEASTPQTVDLGASIPLKHHGLAGQACSIGEPILINDVTQSLGFIATPGLPSVGSELALPLKFAEDTLGVLDIQSERLQAFNPDDMAALQLLAQQVAVAVRNAKIYVEVLHLKSLSA